VNDVPLSRAVELGATTLYVLQVGSFSRPREKPRRPLDVAVSAYWIARHHRYKRDLENLPEGVELHLLPHGQPPLMHYNDFTRTPELIATAYEASSAYLQALSSPAARRAKAQASASAEGAATVEASAPAATAGADAGHGEAASTPPDPEPSDNVLA
jgi:NTE family protein